MPETPLDQLSGVLHEATRAIAAIKDDQWGLPTPCTDWTILDLVNHQITGNRIFAQALGGEDARPPLPRANASQQEAPAAYRETADALLAAFAEPGAMERVVTVPFGTVPGIAALHLRIVETLTHGWDLAQATGQPVRFDDALVEQALHFTRARLGDVSPERSPFKPPQPVAEDAPALDRLAACLGRPVRPV